MGIVFESHQVCDCFPIKGYSVLKSDLLFKKDNKSIRNYTDLLIRHNPAIPATNIIQTWKFLRFSNYMAKFPYEENKKKILAITH